MPSIFLCSGYKYKRRLPKFRPSDANCTTLQLESGTQFLSHTPSKKMENCQGKKCFMLSAKELSIAWGDDCRYWKWISSCEGSRFSEVAELLDVCWLEISGKMKTAEMTPKTTYVAYLIYKLRPTSYGLGPPGQNASVSLGSFSSKERVCLEADEVEATAAEHCEGEMKHIPHERDDGWMEIALGEFFVDNESSGEVEVRLQADTSFWKSGLIVEGMEFRPKMLPSGGTDCGEETNSKHVTNEMLADEIGEIKKQNIAMMNLLGKVAESLGININLPVVEEYVRHG